MTRENFIERLTKAETRWDLTLEDVWHFIQEGE